MPGQTGAQPVSSAECSESREHSGSLVSTRRLRSDTHRGVALPQVQLTNEAPEQSVHDVSEISRASPRVYSSGIAQQAHEEPRMLYSEAAVTNTNNPTMRSFVQLWRQDQAPQARIQQLEVQNRELRHNLGGAAGEIKHLKDILNKLDVNHQEDSSKIKALAQDKEISRIEISRLGNLLEEAQSHIFNLQPYLKDLTPDEAAKVGSSNPLFSTQLTTYRSMIVYVTQCKIALNIFRVSVGRAQTPKTNC